MAAPSFTKFQQTQGYKMLWTFSKQFWLRFGETLYNLFWRRGIFRYNFGFGYKDVRTVARYHRDKEQQEALKKVVDQERLKGANDAQTMKRIMKLLLSKYPVRRFYTGDGRGKDRWNKPTETLQSFKEISQGKKPTFTIDCDDYAILIYNLARVAGVPAEKLRLCFMKTRTEWHMNVMYIEDGVPYAVEGTYYPSIAYRNFLRKPYFRNFLDSRRYLYEGIKWLWNEDKLWVATGILNKV